MGTRNETIGIKDLKEMLVRQGSRCALTGVELTPENCALDHIVPLCRGGAHAKENAQLVTSVVNKAKGGLLEREFVALCRDVIAFFDRKKNGSP